MDCFQKKVLWTLGVILFAWGCYLAQEAFIVLFVAFIFASAMSPLVEILDRKLPRWLSVFIPFCVFLGLGLLVVLPLITIAFQQFQGLLGDAPKYLDELKQWSDEWLALAKRYPILASLTLDKLFEQFSNQSPAFFSSFTGATLIVSKVLLNGLTALILSFFLILDREKIQNYLLQLLSPNERPHIEGLINTLIRSTGAFVNGQLLFMATFAVLIFIGLSVLEIPFALLFALFSGILTIIPILGPNIAMIPIMILAYLYSDDPMQMVWVLCLFLGVQMVENNVVGPLIMGKAVGLHPIAIILAILIGGLLFGLAGIILAIPFVTCLKIILEEWLPLAPEKV